MEKPTSRIPKLTFGFRKSTKTNGTISEGNSPRGGGANHEAPPPPRSITPSGVKSAPGSNNTSPNLSRSKSLRVPRSNLKSRSNTSLLEPSQEQDELGSHSHSSGDSLESGPAPSRGGGGGGGGETEQKSFLRPRSKTIGSGMRRRINRNSRSMSPTSMVEEGTKANSEVRGRG